MIKFIELSMAGHFILYACENGTENIWSYTKSWQEVTILQRLQQKWQIFYP